MYINRNLPKDTIKALFKCCDSKVDDIYVYIGSCIKKESYKYDRYPQWATNDDVWKGFIEKKDNNYYIDLEGAIKQQLNEIGIRNIDSSSIDTATNPDYYSHTEKQEGKKMVDKI